MQNQSFDIARLEDRLINLGRLVESEPAAQLRHPAQMDIAEWRGADVIVSSDFTWEPGNWADQHALLVRSWHALPVTWLFFELRDAFGSQLNAGNKYDFYASLGEAALKHLAANQPEAEDHRPLLKTILAQGFYWLGVLREKGYIPQNYAWVLHSCDAEGRQQRIEIQPGEESA